MIPASVKLSPWQLPSLEETVSERTLPGSQRIADSHPESTLIRLVECNRADRKTQAVRDIYWAQHREHITVGRTRRGSAAACSTNCIAPAPRRGTECTRQSPPVGRGACPVCSSQWRQPPEPPPPASQRPRQETVLGTSRCRRTMRREGDGMIAHKTRTVPSKICDGRYQRMFYLPGYYLHAVYHLVPA